jgi:hypothetical protein
LIVIALVLLVPREQVTGGRGYDRPPSPLKSPRAFHRGARGSRPCWPSATAPFAIAITLLVVAIGIPTLTNGGDRGELLDAAGDLVPEVISASSASR